MRRAQSLQIRDLIISEGGFYCMQRLSAGAFSQLSDLASLTLHGSEQYYPTGLGCLWPLQKLRVRICLYHNLTPSKCSFLCWPCWTKPFRYVYTDTWDYYVYGSNLPPHKMACQQRADSASGKYTYITYLLIPNGMKIHIKTDLDKWVMSCRAWAYTGAMMTRRVELSCICPCSPPYPWQTATALFFRQMKQQGSQVRAGKPALSHNKRHLPALGWRWERHNSSLRKAVIKNFNK